MMPPTRQASPDRTRTTIDGLAGSAPLRLHALVRESAPELLPPVVLVHGWGISSGYLMPLADSLAGEARVFAPDLPGHGRSDHDSRPLTIGELAQALAAWMDARSLTTALLVGHSMGCQIAVEVALARPDLVCALVLAAPTSDPAARTTGRQLVRALMNSPFERPSLAARAAVDYARAGLAVLRTEMREMITHRIEERLPRLSVPSAVVRGAHDALVPQRWAETVAQLAGAPPPLVVRRWGHVVPYDDPGAVATVVLTMARRAMERG